MEGSDAPSTWHSWANYGHFDICCCSGYSNIHNSICTTSTCSPVINIGIGLHLKAQDTSSSSNPLTAHSLTTSLSELLSFPASHIVVFSFEEVTDGDFSAVVGLRDYQGLSGSTLTQVLQETSEEEYVKYGLENVRFSFNDQDLVFVEQLENQDSFSEVSPASALLPFSAFFLSLLFSLVLLTL